MSSSSKWPAKMNLGFAEEVYYNSLRNPAPVSDEWRSCFDSIALDPSVLPPAPTAGGPDGRIDPLAAADSASNGQREAAGAAALQRCVDKIVSSFRVRGHMEAQIDRRACAANSPLRSSIPASMACCQRISTGRFCRGRWAVAPCPRPAGSSSACVRRMPAWSACSSCTKVEDQPCQSS